MLNIKITKEQKYVDDVPAEISYLFRVEREYGETKELFLFDEDFTLEEMQQIRDELIKKLG